MLMKDDLTVTNEYSIMATHSFLENNMTPAQDIQIALDIPKALARLMILLLDSKIVTADEIEKIGIATNGRVAISRLRRFTEKKRIVINSRRDVGYWIEPAMKTKILSLAESSQKSFAFETGVKGVA